MDSSLTIHHHRQHGFVYSYHGYWGFGEGPKRYRRGGKIKRQNMRHLTPKTKAFLTGNFFFSSFNKYDPLIVLKRNPVVQRAGAECQDMGSTFPIDRGHDLSGKSWLPIQCLITEYRKWRWFLFLTTRFNEWQVPLTFSVLIFWMSLPLKFGLICKPLWIPLQP